MLDENPKCKKGANAVMVVWKNAVNSNFCKRENKLTRRASVCEPRPLVHISMTEYEQKETRTLYWLTAVSQRDALLSNSRGGTRIDWWPE